MKPARIALTHCLVLFVGPGHPMKPARIALTHCLVLHYGLHKKMQVNITTKVVCLCRLLKCFSSFLTNSMGLDQTAPVGAV